MPARQARRVGADAVARLRRSGGERLAELLQRDPETLARAVELGLVRREWVERPGEEQLREVGPVQVLQRWLEGEVERRPSTITKLGLSAVQILSAPSSDEDTDEGVADTLTVVFTDLEGFTTYTAREGDDAASRLLAELQRVVGPIVRGRGGRTVKHLGDGLLLTFASAEAAVLASLELVEAQQEPLRMRAGMHCGEVRVVMRTHDVVGHVVNLAARVVESANGGEVLATAAVRDECGDLPSVAFGRLRRRGFKGVDESVSVCPVTRA